MKPKNFPERRRQRQVTALNNIKAKTKAGKDNSGIISTLIERTAMGSMRDVRTKVNRSGQGVMFR